MRQNPPGFLEAPSSHHERQIDSSCAFNSLTKEFNRAVSMNFNLGGIIADNIRALFLFLDPPIPFLVIEKNRAGKESPLLQGKMRYRSYSCFFKLPPGAP